MKPNGTPFFWIFEIILFCMVVFGLVLYLNARKPKRELLKATGNIELLTDQYNNIDNRHDGKMRFLKVDKNKDVFEVFIGKESGDFAPQFENMDALHTGQEVDIYYMEPMLSDDEPVNRMAQFIDQAGKPYFIKGNTDKLWGTGIMEFCGFLMGVIFILKYKGLIN